MKNDFLSSFQKTQEMPFSDVLGSGGSKGMGFDLLNKTKHHWRGFRGILDTCLRPLCPETSKKG
jgi:hypothetical protein